MAVIVHSDVNRGADKECGNIFNRMRGALAHQAQVGGPQQFLWIGAAAGAVAHFPDQQIQNSRLTGMSDIAPRARIVIDYPG